MADSQEKRGALPLGHEFVAPGGLGVLCDFYLGGNPEDSWSYCRRPRAAHDPAPAPMPKPVDLVSRRHEGAGISVERSSAGSSEDAPMQQRSAGPSVEPQSETVGQLLTHTGDEINSEPPPQPLHTDPNDPACRRYAWDICRCKPKPQSVQTSEGSAETWAEHLARELTEDIYDRPAIENRKEFYEALELALRLENRKFVDAILNAHGDGQESAIRDVNAGLIDDMITPRLDARAQEAARNENERWQRAIGHPTPEAAWKHANKIRGEEVERASRERDAEWCHELWTANPESRHEDVLGPKEGVAWITQRANYAAQEAVREERRRVARLVCDYCNRYGTKSEHFCEARRLGVLEAGE